MKLSLVMATVGRTEEVWNMIRSLVNQSDHNFELIIVDQNSDDRLALHIRAGLAQGLDIRHVRLEPPSLSAARNLGISLARYEILAFPDDDCWYESTVIEHVRNCFIPESELRGLVAHWEEQAKGLGRPQLTGQLSLHAWRRFRGGEASSIALFFRRELFDELGGFDERLGVGRWYGAGEETDFVLRALASGARLDHAPQVRVHHHFSAKQPGDWRIACRNIRRRARGTGAIYAKHRLDVYVIIRGCSAPLLRVLLKWRSPRNLVQSWFMVIGRLEGLIRWKLTENNFSRQAADLQRRSRL
jgi:glycosyltransferase involved in cell wall biosynthesis